MPLALDGSQHANVNPGTSVSASLTTTHTNDIIVAIVTTNDGPLSSVAGGSLTWTRAINQGNCGGTAAFFIEMWYAIAASTLSAASITATCAGNSFNTLDVFGISGGNTTTPLDGSALSALTAPMTISTTNANDIIVSGFRQSGQASPGAGTGFTLISGADFQCSQYKIVSTTQSSLSVTDSFQSDVDGGVLAAFQAAPTGDTFANEMKMLMMSAAPIIVSGQLFRDNGRKIVPVRRKLIRPAELYHGGRI